MEKMEIKDVSEFDINVYRIVSYIPSGKVCTYGQIAEVIGNKGLSRAVGSALRRNPYAPFVPCHRVVKADGDISGYFGDNGELKDLKGQILIKEGISVNEKRKIVGLSDYLFNIKEYCSMLSMGMILVEE